MSVPSSVPKSPTTTQTDEFSQSLAIPSAHTASGSTGRSSHTDGASFTSASSSGGESDTTTRLPPHTRPRTRTRLSSAAAIHDRSVSRSSRTSAGLAFADNQGSDYDELDRGEALVRERQRERRKMRRSAASSTSVAGSGVGLGISNALSSANTSNRRSVRQDSLRRQRSFISVRTSSAPVSPRLGQAPASATGTSRADWRSTAFFNPPSSHGSEEGEVELLDDADLTQQGFSRAHSDVGGDDFAEQDEDLLEDDEEGEGEEEITLRDRQDAINIEHPFGLPIWKPALYKKSRSVQRAADSALLGSLQNQGPSLIIPNVLWLVCAGFWLSCACYTSGTVVLFAQRGRRTGHAALLFGLAWYIIWPFGGKYLEGRGMVFENGNGGPPDALGAQSSEEHNEHEQLLSGPARKDYSAISSFPTTVKPTPAHDATSKLGQVIFWLITPIFVYLPLLITCGLAWFFVFPIPMARLLWVLLRHLASSPLSLRFRDPIRSGNTVLAGQSTHGEQGTVLACIYRAAGFQYYKYTVAGVNIMFINLVPLVFAVILDAFLLLPYVESRGFDRVNHILAFAANRITIFVLSLASVIPLSYFIGMAVASISAQSSIGMGAVINATFGSVIEIILYSFALADGVLLMPGLSMVSGAFRRKEQRFNAKSAGVTSTMLIMAIIGTLTPTLFYQTYGTSQLSCSGCPDGTDTSAPWTCQRCHYQHIPPQSDSFYLENVKDLMYFCSIILVVSYLIGLWFSLKTHASQIWQNPQQLMHVGELSNHPLAPSDTVLPNQRASVYKYIPSAFTRTLPSHHAGTVRQSIAFAHPASPRMDKRSSSPGHARLSSGQRDGGITPVLPPLNTGIGHSGQIHMPSSLTTAEFTHAVALATASALRQQQDRERKLIVDANSAEHGGHDAPEWSRMTSTTVLLSCTFLYAIIAEILVDVVDVVLEGSGIDEKFLGISLFALVPNTTEFMNAMSFALNGNIALSMEIGSAYALQVCLLQIPAMVAFSAWSSYGSTPRPENMFTLIFPRWDAIAIILSIFLLTYTYIEARANYHRGSILILSYMVLAAGFWFAPALDEAGGGPGDKVFPVGSYLAPSSDPIAMSGAIPQFLSNPFL